MRQILFFENIWNHKLFGHKTWQTKIYRPEQEEFCMFWKARSKPRPFLIHQSTKSTYDGLVF